MLKLKINSQVDIEAIFFFFYAEGSDIASVTALNKILISILAAQSGFVFAFDSGFAYDTIQGIQAVKRISVGVEYLDIAFISMRYIADNVRKGRTVRIVPCRSVILHCNMNSCDIIELLKRIPIYFIGIVLRKSA